MTGGEASKHLGSRAETLPGIYMQQQQRIGQHASSTAKLGISTGLHLCRRITRWPQPGPPALVIGAGVSSSGTISASRRTARGWSRSAGAVRRSPAPRRFRRVVALRRAAGAGRTRRPGYLPPPPPHQHPPRRSARDVLGDAAEQDYVLGQVADAAPVYATAPLPQGRRRQFSRQTSGCQAPASKRARVDLPGTGQPDHAEALRQVQGRTGPRACSHIGAAAGAARRATRRGISSSAERPAGSPRAAAPSRLVGLRAPYLHWRPGPRSTGRWG